MKTCKECGADMCCEYSWCFECAKKEAFDKGRASMQSRIDELNAEIARERAAVCTMIDESNELQSENRKLLATLKVIKDWDWAGTHLEPIGSMRQFISASLYNLGDKN